MILTVEVKPNARESKVISWKDRATVIIAIAAPAMDGKANRELIEFLSDKLGVAKSLIEIKRGHSGRVKHVVLPETVNLSVLGQ